MSALLSSKLGIRVEKNDIDVAHRLGKFTQDKTRPVIVKFVRRQTKSDVMRNAKLLKDTGIFLNEDLTKLNAEVLASARLKAPEMVERAWAFEGKLYVRYKGKDRADRIEYEQFQMWLKNHGRRRSDHSRMPAKPRLTRIDAVSTKLSVFIIFDTVSTNLSVFISFDTLYIYS